MDTGEGKAIAAGTKELKDIDVDEAFAGFSGKLAFVLQTRGVELSDGQAVNLRDPRLQQPAESAFSAFVGETGEWSGVDAANQTLKDRNQS